MARPRKPWFRKSNKRCYVEVEGKQVCLGPSRKDAFRRFHELMAQPEPTTLPVRTGALTLPEVVDHFLDWVQRNRAGDTYEWYRYRLERLAQTYPDLKAQELKPFHVQQWVDSYANLSRTSRRNYLRTIKRCLKWAVKQGYIESSPLEYLEVPGADRKESLITTEQYESLVAKIPEPNFRDLVIVTWETGCRPQESLRVEARHVDLKNRRWVFPKCESKGKRQPRVVYLSPAAYEITARLVNENPEGPLFRNSNGKPWTTDAVNCAFDRIRLRLANETEVGLNVCEAEVKKLIPQLKATRLVKGVELPKSDAELRKEARKKLRNKKAGELVPRFSLYALRHAWATRALQSGLDGLTVAILMGHSDPSTLARVYQHLSHNPQHLLAQAAKVQR